MYNYLQLTAPSGMGATTTGTSDADQRQREAAAEKQYQIDRRSLALLHRDGDKVSLHLVLPLRRAWPPAPRSGY